jgi:hypothetical protein
MFDSLNDSLNDINLDPTVQPARHRHRLLWVLGIPATLLAIALSILLISRINVFPSTVSVENDTSGTVVCYQRYQSNGHDFVQDAGRIAAGDQTNVQAKSSCAVFDIAGRYVSCLIVPDDKNVERIAASTADRSINTETCVYPR